MRKIKGLILTAGKGTRLYPISLSTNKQLLPVYDKPMIYYSISILLELGITDIGIVCNRSDLDSFKKLFIQFSKWKVNIEYIIQEEQNGIAHALKIAREQYLFDSDVCMILGDNIFINQTFDLNFNNALIYAYPVPNPKSFGVLEFSKDFSSVISLEEKPEHPKSNFIIPGIYFYSSDALKFLDSLKPSLRGEYEITDFNTLCLQNNLLEARLMNAEAIWMDTGTCELLFEASEVVRKNQILTGRKIGCIEETAYRKKIISKEDLKEFSKKMLFSDYGKYLNSIE
jgi:glucose-1-phosphate thymidylyltransferase